MLNIIVETPAMAEWLQAFAVPTNGLHRTDRLRETPRGFSQTRFLIYCATVWLEVETEKMSDSRSPCAAIWRKWRTFAVGLRMSPKNIICTYALSFPLQVNIFGSTLRWYSRAANFFRRSWLLREKSGFQKNAFIKISKRIVCVVHSNTRACAFAKSHSHFGWFDWENTETFHDGCRDEKHRT